jgi:hypothetical protein
MDTHTRRVGRDGPHYRFGRTACSLKRRLGQRVAIDDEIDAARTQIEVDQPSIAMKATTAILDTLAGLLAWG